MKGNRRLIAVVAIALLTGGSVFAMQGRGRGGGGQGGGPRGGVGGPSNAGGNRGRGNAPSSLPGNPGGPRGNNPGNGPDNNNRGNSDSRGNSQRGNSADNKPDTAGPKDPEGFKNYGQYVAAKHVSDNLGIAFGDLKKSMVDDKMSLGESIHKFRPNLSQKEVDDHARKAEDAGKKAEEEEARKKDKSSE